MHNNFSKNMKRKYYFLLLLYICANTHAQEYSIAEIDSIAYNFFNHNPQYTPSIDGSIPTKQISSIETIERDGTNYMYIVNTEESAGWIIVSNEKTYPAIIAHSDSGNLIYDEESLPPALLCILDNHMDAIDSTRNNPQMTIPINYASTYAKAPATKNNLIACDSWQQYCNNDSLPVDADKMYNKYCDRNLLCIGGCYREYVGCGPVAMAKIMRYWQWPDSFTTKGFLSLNRTTYYYDWDNMPKRIDNSTDMYLVDAVAHLFRSCGIAATTWYTHFGSATLIEAIHNAMIKDFGFHSNLVQAKKEGVDVTSMLISEINEGRPVLVQAHDKIIFDGHSFVVDGYKTDANQQVKFHIHFGQGYDDKAYNNYCDLTFNGYPNGHVFLIELYPECSFRANDMSLSNTFTIDSLNNRTFYSANNVTLCSNNNSIIVNSGGHLLVKAGNEVHINRGFHAKSGSDVKIRVDELCYDTSSTSSAPQRMASRTSPSNDAGSTDETATYNGVENITNNAILSTSIYTISGQLIQTIAGGQHDVTHLPNGIYILQHRMNDGSVRSEKIANNK